MIVLGTTSKRRIDIFNQFSLEYILEPSFFNEDLISLTHSPKEYVSKLAKEKATAIYNEGRHHNLPILTADTCVFFENTILNKPLSLDEALETVSSYSGKTQEIWTGVCLHTTDALFVEADCTHVEFHSFSKEEAKAYVTAVKPFDRAGSYSLFDVGGLLVKKIDGDFFNAVGFPIKVVQKLLLKVNINLWDFIKPLLHV